METLTEQFLIKTHRIASHRPLVIDVIHLYVRCMIYLETLMVFYGTHHKLSDVKIIKIVIVEKHTFDSSFDRSILMNYDINSKPSHKLIEGHLLETVFAFLTQSPLNLAPKSILLIQTNC